MTCPIPPPDEHDDDPFQDENHGTCLGCGDWCDPEHLLCEECDEEEEIDL